MKIDRVLIINLKSLPAWHLDLATGFGQLGRNAEVFITTPQTVVERFEKSVLGKKWFRSPAVLSRLVKHCHAFRPQAIIFLGMFVLPTETVERLRSALKDLPLLCGWVCDCFREPQFEPFVRADHVFYFDTFLERVLPQHYPDQSQCTYLPLAANPDRYRPIVTVPFNQALLFVGNVSANRAALLSKLSPAIKMEVHGPNAAGRTYNRRRKLNSDQINNLYNSHAAVLNINQSPNTEHGANLRVFEATAAGAPLLTQACDDLAALYEPNVEVLPWSSTDDVVTAYQALVANGKRTREMGAAGRRRTLAEHTFKHRAASILKTLES